MKRFTFLITILFLLQINYSHSQIIPADTSDKVINLNEVVISANKVPELKKDVSQQTETITAKQIQQSNPQTSADMIANTGQVLVQKSQQGGGSPVIRGFEASRVVLVVDGVRMNNIIYRAGHLQNIITMDNSILDRVEILFGPSSTVYGSDALGGVIHFHTRNPVLSDISGELNTHVNAFARFSTANFEKTGHADVSIGGKKFGSLTSFTYSDYDDLKSGKNKNSFYDSLFTRPYYVERINGIDSLVTNEDEFEQKFSGYSQYDILQKFLFKQNGHVQHLLNFQLSNSSDIPRYDRLTDPGSGGVGLNSSEWYYGPQFRLMAAYGLGISDLSGFFNEYRVGLNYQSIEESRNDRRFGKDFLRSRTENVGVMGFSLDAHHKNEVNDLRVGIEGQFNTLESTAEQLDIVADTTASLNTRYPDGDNTMKNLAAYATDTWKINDNWVLNSGLRFQSIMLHSTFVSKEFFDFPFTEVDQKNSALSGTLGIIYNTDNNWRFSLMGSTGFRAPDVDDLAKVFESAAGSIIVPNPDLKPEKTYNGDLSIGKVFSQVVKIEAIGFYTLFNDAIVIDKFTYDGQDSILYDGVMSEVLANQNKQEAFLYGFMFNLYADIADDFSLTSTLSYTKGQIKQDTGNAPLDHIPPVIGKTSFVYHHEKIRGEFFVNYNGWKHIEDYYLNGEDNEQYATPDGMPAWFTLNIRGSYQFTKNLTAQLAVENILDTNYRVFASGFSAPGRNFVIALRGNF